MNYANASLSKCTSRYDFVEQAENSRNLAWLPGKVFWKLHEALVSVQEEWRTSHYNCHGSRLESS